MRNLDDDIEMKLPEIKPRERTFEYALRDELKLRGVLFIKTKPTVEGFPDRLAIGHGSTRLCELKREGEGLSDVQRIVHADLKRRGVGILVLHGPDVKAAADEVETCLRRSR